MFKNVSVMAVLACASAWVSSAFAETAHWYVNPDRTLASDDYDGSAPVWAGGESKVGPKRTLTGAMAIEGLKSGDVVHAAEGTYDENEFYVSSASNRVAVKGGVGLVADGARERTIIKGAPCANPDNLTTGLVSVGIGPSAVRPVFLYGDAYIKGFTITGGYTPNGVNGGGIMQASTSCAIECVISNNVCGYRGSGASEGTYIRCYVEKNGTRKYYTNEVHTLSTTVGNYGIYMAEAVIGTIITGADVYYGNGLILNCHFNGGRTWGTKMKPVYNSYILNDNGYKAYTNCVFGKDFNLHANSTKDEATCVKATVVMTDLVDENYRPKTGSLLIDAGDTSWYETEFPEKWAAFKTGDFAGGPRVIGAIDACAGEYDWYPVATDTGLTVTRGTEGETTTITAARNYTSEKLCLGFTYGDTTVLFADHPEGYVWTNTLPKDAAFETLAPIHETTQTNWYVDAVNGSDTNKGYSVYCPKKTLAAIMTGRASGDRVFAAAGVYDEGTMGSADNMSRVKIPTGVGLISTDPGHAATTAIVGYTPSYTDTTNGETKFGGAGSIRCVASATTGYVKGFTLRDGATDVQQVASGKSYGNTGGAISGGTAIDCVITNCIAVRGSAGNDARMIRCRVVDCSRVTTGTNALGQVGETLARNALYGGSAYDSYLGNDCGTLNAGPFVNCFVRGSLWDNDTGNGYCRVYNSYVQNNNGGIAFTNCVVLWYNTTSSIYYETQKGVSNIRFDDATGMPMAGETRLIDRGDVANYTYPEAWAHEAGKDINGNPRVLNGAIDIGCGEYDWRPTFAAALPTKGVVTVVEASANVTTNVTTGLILSGGDRVTLTWEQTVGGESSFTLTQNGEGTALVRLNGEELAAVSPGVYVFRGTAGTFTIEISYTGTGTVTLANLRAARKPMVMMIR